MSISLTELNASEISYNKLSETDNPRSVVKKKSTVIKTLLKRFEFIHDIFVVPNWN